MFSCWMLSDTIKKPFLVFLFLLSDTPKAYLRKYPFQTVSNLLFHLLNTYDAEPSQKSLYNNF